MYLLDTSILIGILREDPVILRKYNALPPKVPRAITTFAVAELHEGLLLIQNETTQNAQRRILELILNSLETRSLILTLTRQGAEVYAGLSNKLRIKGTAIPVMDLLIGTIAIVTKNNLITLDKNHFQKLQAVQPALQVEYW